MSKFERDRLLTSQIRLRRIVGALGIGLPFILPIASFVCMDATMVESSISAYYGTEMRDIFVGIMCVIGVFLFAYKGYDAWDDRASHLAGVSAVGVALFPVTCYNEAIVAIHYLSATVLFLTLAYISRYRFTRSSPKKAKTEGKKKRNKVYKWCAYVMIFGLIAIGAFKLSGLSAMSCNAAFIVSTIVLALIIILFLIRVCVLRVCYKKEAILYRILKKFFSKKLELVYKWVRLVYKWVRLVIFFLFPIGVGVWAGCYLPCCQSGCHRPCTFVFAIEFVMLMAFGLSWIVKGDTLWSDEDDKQSQCRSKKCRSKKCCSKKCCSKKCCSKKCCSQKCCSQKCCSQKCCSKKCCSQKCCSKKCCSQKCCSQKCCSKKCCSQKCCSQKCCSQKCCGDEKSDDDGENDNANK